MLVKAGGPLGLSIVGGIDHSSHPFGIEEPGIFISKIVPDGAASRTSLRIGDRILAVRKFVCCTFILLHRRITRPYTRQHQTRTLGRGSNGS